MEAKNGLENYLYSLRGTLRDEKVAAKLSADDKRRMQEIVDGAVRWLDGNQTAEKEEFEDKQKEVEGVCQPIITAMYQQARARRSAGLPTCLLAAAGARQHDGGRRVFFFLAMRGAWAA